MLLTIIIFIIVLSIIVLVHEFGHFFVARAAKVHVEEFGIGFPPRVFGFKRKNMLWSINALPFGGFVKLKGEQGDHENDPDSFAHVALWKRASILVAGVFMNVVLAYIIITAVLIMGTPQILNDSNAKIPSYANLSEQHVQVFSILESSPAQDAGIEPGDRIISLDATQITESAQISAYIQSRADTTPISITVERENQTRTFEATPKIIESQGDKPVVGMSTATVATVRYPFFYSLYEGVKETGRMLGSMVQAFWSILVGVFTPQAVPADVVGPVGIAVLTGKIAQLGFVYLLQFIALISLNLAIINIIPFPALDGGRLLFVVLERLRGKPVNARIEAIIHNTGFIILLVLIAFITLRDLFNLSTINALF